MRGNGTITTYRTKPYNTFNSFTVRSFHFVILDLGVVEGPQNNSRAYFFILATIPSKKIIATSELKKLISFFSFGKGTKKPSSLVKEMYFIPIVLCSLHWDGLGSSTSVSPRLISGARFHHQKHL